MLRYGQSIRKSASQSKGLSRPGQILSRQTSEVSGNCGSLFRDRAIGVFWPLLNNVFADPRGLPRAFGTAHVRYTMSTQ